MDSNSEEFNIIGHLTSGRRKQMIHLVLLT